MILLLLPFLFGASVSQNICDSPVDLGTAKCSNTSSIRYHYDPTVKRCLPFGYTGCGGNENNFADPRICRQRCIPQDHHVCPANTPSTLNTGGAKNCGKEEHDEKCAEPNKNYCHHGPNNNGVCCSLESRKKVDQDRELVCPNGKKKYATFRGGKDRAFIGKSCDHKFCPTGFDCQKGNFYSYCCAK